MEIQILKVRSVNSIIAFILTGLLHNTVYSQKKLEGTYCLEHKYSGDFSECLEFREDNTFEYNYLSDVGMVSYAQGEYEFADSQLILNYNKTAPLKMSYHISEIWKNNKDSITVDFNLFDFDGKPAAGVNVLHKDSLSQKGFKSVDSNEDGRASFKLKKDASELEFEISSMDYGLTASILHIFYHLKIYKEWNYKISVYLQKSYTGIPILNQTDTLELKKVRKQFFEVKNKDESVTTWRKLED